MASRRRSSTSCWSFTALFPDAPRQDSGQEELPIEGLTPRIPAHGNAIRKAYLCHSKIRHMPLGATVLFYQSSGGNEKKQSAVNRPHFMTEKAIAAAGVAESILRPTSPAETALLTFKRTVFSQQEVAELHEGRESILTLLFRHDRFLDPAWSLEELMKNCILRGAPQSIMQIKDRKAIEWVEKNLNV